jgi:hypothetical protein
MAVAAEGVPAPGLPGGHRSRILRAVSGVCLVLLLGGGCLLGKGRGEYWEGVSSGSGGECGRVEFEINVSSGRVTGGALMAFPWGTAVWTVQGAVDPEGKLTLETLIDDPRVTRQRVLWTGTMGLFRVELAEVPDGTCPAPRTAALDRR